MGATSPLNVGAMAVAKAIAGKHITNAVATPAIRANCVVRRDVVNMSTQHSR
jgi:hypothetical protein